MALTTHYGFASILPWGVLMESIFCEVRNLGEILQSTELGCCGQSRTVATETPERRLDTHWLCFMVIAERCVSFGDLRDYQNERVEKQYCFSFPRVYVVPHARTTILSKNGAVNP